ncbi:25S rRNA (adenine645-N1)-methyltransferase [Lignoscripta atroalba]|nr:25S rRNA (adenine645-N1)-methyltransferase [Lignoscripta atroalba]
MFAVPGWAVSADSLKTQEDTESKKAKNHTKFNISSDIAKPPKKRKRDTERVRVTEENLASLWEKHIEGKNPSGNATRQTANTQKHSKVRKRSDQNGDGAASALPGGDGANENPDAIRKGLSEKRKTLKEKKREKKAIQQANGDLTQTLSSTAQSSAPSTSTSPAQVGMNVHQTPSSSTNASWPIPRTELTPLQTTMREKLQSARFRHLNQTLYTTPSDSSLALFTRNPSFYAEYHEGFRRQVSVWPENPVDGFVRWIRARGVAGRGGVGSQRGRFRKEAEGKKKTGEKTTRGIRNEEAARGEDNEIEPLPRNPKTGSCTIADLGCGDAKLAQTLSTPTSTSPPDVKRLNLHVHSFDLAAPSPLVTVADIRSLPLTDSSLDIAIFSLALMGTNWIEFVEEAWRVLRWRGECWISEVNSRFVRPKDRPKRVDHSIGNRMKNGANGKGLKRPQAADELENVVVGVNFPNEIFAAGAGDSGPNTVDAKTDVAAFVEVLRSRGFVLTGEPELGNKMFVRMRFVKGVTPTRGKGVPVQNDAGGQTWGRKKFVEVGTKGEGIGVEEEGRVLKPCVYKIR